MRITFFYLAIAGLLAASCSNDIVDEPQQSVKTKNTIVYSPTSVNRTLDEAIRIANDAKWMLNSKKASRACIDREIDLTDGIKYVVSNVSRSNPDTLLYILNYKDNAGFAVISAKRSTEALIALIESGTYTSLEDCDNPGFLIAMDMAVNYISNAPFNPPSGDGFEIQERKEEEIILKNDTILHKTNVTWGQTGIYGAYCPNGIAGCANTAIGTAMNYFKYPQSLELTHDNKKTLILDWNNINKHAKGTFDIYCCTENIHKTIGLLLREIGFRSKSDYKDPNQTSTYIKNTINTLKELGYKVGSLTKYTQNCVKNQLGSGIIIMYGEDEAKRGHIWVVEGYVYLKKQIIEYVRPISSREWTESNNITIESTLNWMNWGWNGAYDGLFTDGIFQTEAGNLKNNVHYFTVNI